MSPPPPPFLKLIPKGTLLSINDSLKRIGFLSIPIFGQQFLRFAQVLVNFAFIAHYDDAYMLEGLGLAFYVIFNMSFFIGFNIAVTTFAAQLEGMGRMKDSGMYLNAGRIINMMICVPVFFVLLFSDTILTNWGQDETTAYYACQFLRGLIFGLPFICLAILHNYYMNSFRKMAPGNIATLLGFILQILFSAFFIFYLGWGLFGAGVAVSCSNIAQSIFLFCALFYYPDVREAQYLPQMTYQQWSYMKEFLSIGVPSMLMATLEIAGVEMMQPLAGLISSDSNAAQAVVMNIYAGVFTLYLAVSIATSIFVGSTIGTGNIPQAKRFTRVSVIIVLGITAVLYLILLIWKEEIIGFYSSSASVQDLAMNALTFFALALLPDCIIYSQMGAFRGLGQQKVAAIISITSLITLSIPLGCLFAFYFNMDISGFWVGYAVRSAVAVGIYWYLLHYSFDWEQIGKEALEREEKQRLLKGPPLREEQLDTSRQDYGSFETDQTQSNSQNNIKQ